MKVLQDALTLIDGGDAQGAITLLTQPHDEKQPAWPVFLGLAYADAGDLVQAAQHLREAVRLAPENRLARGFLAVLKLRENKPDEALKLLDKWGIEASPRLLGRLLVEMERTLIRLGAAEGSRLRDGVRLPDGPLEATVVTHAEAAQTPLAGDDAAGASKGSDDAAGGAEGGDEAAGASRGSDDAAGGAEGTPWDPPIIREGLLDRIVGAIVDPLFAQIMVSRADKALFKQRSAVALERAREAVRRYPDIPRGFCVLGLAYLNQDDPRSALRCLAEAVERDGETPDVLYAQGCCHHEMGNLDEARRCLRKMLAAFAKDAAAYYTLAQIDLEQGNEREARQHFERAAFLDFLIVRERLKRLATAVSKGASNAG